MAMMPIGKWNGIRHYSRLQDFSLNDFSEVIKVNAIDNIKYTYVGKNGYVIEVRQHPTGNLEEAHLCEVEDNKVIINVPEKLRGTETFVLFGSGTEIEFTRDQLCATLANELKTTLDYIWNNSLPMETYRDYLKKTMR